ncbi:transposon Tf2-2 polyprotein [Citrus sinensis]|uniref:Transposon Tf2-2 polyprotein n=1 Tax=Citrus sinensis TaxID=2711 RepID=A0ACB8JKD9_CITSI|nr:transposon Tf2-2 polyprotein [Citrus sinensis]
MLSPIRQYDPSKLFCMTHTLFRDNPLPPPPKPKPKPKLRPQPRPVTFHIPGQHSPGHTPASPPVPLPPTESQPPSQSKDKQPMHQFSAHTVDHSSTTDDQTSDSNLAVSDSHTETDTESSVSTSDSEKSYADITRILMAQPDQPPPGQTSHTEPYVDIPSEVDEEMPESSATNQPPPAQAHTSSPSQKSSNGPWFTFDDLPSHKWRDRLNEMSAWIDLQMLRNYRQLQFVQLPEVSSALAVIHDQFLGDPSAVFEAAQRDYLNMKCCSLNAKDLDFHYKRMSLLFYKLNGFNEPTLKHVFLASLPDELQPDIQRQLTASNLSLDNISLGKIFQLAKTCLDKLCEQKPRRSRKPYRFFIKKSSSSRDFKRRKSSICFICKKKGHYAKDCPNKREKSIRLVEHLQATTDYSPEKDELEFYFSEQDKPNDETVFALQNSSDDSDSDQSQIIFHQQLLSLDTTIPIPSIKLQLLPSKFQRPIPAIGLIDTGAQRSILNPHILPPEYWTEYEEHFKAVNGKLFTTSLITKKPIGIQIFSNCIIWTKVIGSTLPNKDLLLGFGILHQIKHLQILPNGIRVKSIFKPFTDILKLYNLSETPQPYQDISNKLLSFCPESHSEFTHPNPLWKNKSFFIKLPFKLNEDINPTKATHPGMSPSDLLLAQQECSQLLAQGLIEPTNSQWACQAFYVEKHYEIIRGKKRLVIDYQSLNMFLQDDRFPLPRRQSMFTFLKNAQIFSKFDLKSGSHDEHRQLLTQFYDIVHSHGIMLSTKKSTIATDNIEFLDFIPHVDHYTHHLSALLKKKPPEWNTDHTNAVTTLKQIAQNPPPLKLITDGKRILQTDTSDDSWGAILLEEITGKEHFIAYASGQFSDTQKHYHSVFKEILAVKNGIKKFEYHLTGHHFLICMDSSAFPNILNFKGKTVPEKMLLRLKDWFSKYDFSVKHIKGSQNLIPDMLSRLSKPEKPLTMFSTTYHFPIISMATSLPPEALTKKTFPFNKTFSSVFAIQEFVRKALFRFFMKAYLVIEPFPFSSFHPENLFLTGLTLDPSRETTEDVLWYLWCLRVFYATKLVLPITPTLEHLLDPDKATSLTWTLLEWFSPIPWWRKKLQQLSEIYNLEPVIENEIQDVLHNYLCQLNHQPPPLKDIFHTSLGPQHDLLMIPTPSAISKPKSTGIIIKEEKPDYTDFLYQDSQDPWEDFLPLSQHLQQFPQPSMNEPGSSSQPPQADTATKPSKVDKATQTSPRPGYRRDCPYPPCRGPHCKHPKLSKTFFPKSNCDNSYETESSSEDEYMNLRSP